MSWFSENEKQDFLESLWWTWMGAKSSGEGGPGPTSEGRGAQVFGKRAANLPQDLTRQRRVTVLEGNAERVGSPSSINGTDEPVCRAETETQTGKKVWTPSGEEGVG